MSEDPLCPECDSFDKSKLREVGCLGQCTVTGIGIIEFRTDCLDFSGKKPERKIEVVVQSD